MDSDRMQFLFLLDRIYPALANNRKVAVRVLDCTYEVDAACLREGIVRDLERFAVAWGVVTVIKRTLDGKSVRGDSVIVPLLPEVIMGRFLFPGLEADCQLALMTSKAWIHCMEEDAKAEIDGPEIVNDKFVFAIRSTRQEAEKMASRLPDELRI